MKKKIALIGTGIAGIYAARELSGIAEVTIFEKSRGFGGRMSTRTRGEYQFDHGAQYFTARTKSFQKFLSKFINNGSIFEWSPNLVEVKKEGGPKFLDLESDEPFYVPTPRMSSFCRYLASELNVNLETKVDKIIKENNKWTIYQDSKSLGEFDWVICAIPSHQVIEVMPDCFIYKNEITNIKMQGCYSLMLGYNSPLNIKWDAAKVNGYDISWVAINSIKPERSSKYSIISHSTNEWAENNIEANQEDVKSHLISELSDIMELDLTTADHIDLHRWRYANIKKQSNKDSYVDFDNKLAACGDWCIEGRIEAAFLSAKNLVDSIKHEL